MAALRRITRQTASTTSSTAELRQKRGPPRRRRNNSKSKSPQARKKVKEVKKEEEKEEEPVEVVNLCSDSEGEESPPGTPPEKDNDSLEVDEEEEEEEEDGGSEFQTYFDFGSDDSLASLTVRSFLRDCFRHPKILCHQKFHGLRTFMEKVMGKEFTLPEDTPFPMDHEDDTFCVDKNDKWLEHLKERLLYKDPSSTNRPQNRNQEQKDEDSDDEDDPPSHYWAKITPVQRKSDLGLIIFRWTPLPVSLPLLDIYLTFCENKYVPAKPPPPPPPPPPSPPPRQAKRTRRKRRRTRASLRLNGGIKIQEEEDEEEIIVVEKVQEPEVEKKEEDDTNEEDIGLDDYIKDFIAVFKLERNMDVEERLKGDLDARARRQREEKEEPKYSRELNLLVRSNRLYNTPVILTSRKTPAQTNGRSTSDSDSDSSSNVSTSSSVTSKESACSEYRARIRGPRGSYKTTRAKPSPSETTPPSTPKRPHTSSSVVTNGLAMMSRQGTIRRNSPNRSESGSSSSSKSSSVSPGTRRPGRLLSCDVCRPPKHFATLKSLYRHLTNKHGSRKRVLMTCECGISIRKERLPFHQRYCKKAIMSGNGRISPLSTKKRSNNDFKNI